jgi:hypothetical protein
MDTKESTEPVRTVVSRPRGKWKDSHVVFFVLPIALTVLFPGGGIFYLCGRFRPDALTFIFVNMMYLAAVAFIFICFLAGIVRLSFRWGARTRNERLLIAAETAVPLIFLGLIVATFFLKEAELCGYRYGLFLYGLRDRVRSKVDIGATRTWLQSLDTKELDDHYNRIPRSDWPQSLSGLKGAVRMLAVDENGNAKVRLAWGSTPIEGHWGIDIGAEDMKIPPSDFSLYGEYRVPVEPGVYVWQALE